METLGLHDSPRWKELFFPQKWGVGVFTGFGSATSWIACCRFSIISFLFMFTFFTSIKNDSFDLKKLWFLLEFQMLFKQSKKYRSKDSWCKMLQVLLHVLGRRHCSDDSLSNLTQVANWLTVLDGPSGVLSIRTCKAQRCIESLVQIDKVTTSST